MQTTNTKMCCEVMLVNDGTLYIRMHERMEVSPNSLIKLGDISQIVTQLASLQMSIKNMPVHQVEEKDKNMIVIDVMQVIEKVQEVFPQMEVQTIGPAQTVIEVKYPKRSYNIVTLISIWLLLFIGSGLAIMNFHEDVSMQEVHQNMYYLLTGKKLDKPLLLQIPYSFGLGIGMVLFFNHLFKKRINEEPSPLEVEMLKYQQNLDQYTILEERKGRRKSSG
jgi:stage V sporulation protein AA